MPITMPVARTVAICNFRRFRADALVVLGDFDIMGENLNGIRMPLTNLEFAHKRLFKRACDYVDRQAGEPFIILPVKPELIASFISEKNKLLVHDDILIAREMARSTSLDKRHSVAIFIKEKLVSRFSRLVLYPDKNFREQWGVKRGFGPQEPVAIPQSVDIYLLRISMLIACDIYVIETSALFASQ